MIQKKICILGAAGVGKTSLTAQFVYSKFSEKYLSSMGVKIDKKIIELKNSSVNLMIWDVHGEEKYKKIPASYLRGSSGVMMVIDGTRHNTLITAEEILERVKTEVGSIPYIFLLNKSDLDDEWDISNDEILKLKATGFPVFLTSAKTGANVEASFLSITEAMLAS